MEEVEKVPRIDFEKEANTPFGEMRKTKHPNNPDFLVVITKGDYVFPWPMTMEQYDRYRESLEAEKNKKE